MILRSSSPLHQNHQNAFSLVDSLFSCRVLHPLRPSAVDVVPVDLFVCLYYHFPILQFYRFFIPNTL